MRILFVQPSADFFVRGTTYPVCRSIMTTASYMKSLGYEVLVYDRCVDFRKKEKIFEEFDPQTVMIYVPPTASLSEAVEISLFAQKRGCITVWGEVVAAALAEKAVESGSADFVINGETEYKLEMLIKELSGNKDFSAVPGLTYSQNGSAVTNKNQNCTDLSQLPPIDWELIDVEKCFRKFPYCKKMLYMYTSRGCPYKCTYCYNTMFYNSEHRKRPLSFVLGEIRYLEEKYGLDGVNFSDELLLFSDEEIEEIASFRKNNNLKFLWGGETRADVYKDVETLKKMYDAGCRWMMLGIETGSDKTRSQINKPMQNKTVSDFVDKCTEAGISTFGSFMIGFPDETEEQLRETAEFACSLNLDAFLFNYYITIPKTPMCDALIEAGRMDVSEMFSNTKPAHHMQTLSKNYSKISNKELLAVKSWFDWMTFTRRKKEIKEKNAFLKKAIDSLKHFAQGNIKDSLNNVMNAFRTFATVWIYSHCFPKIRKKYGLKNVNKK